MELELIIEILESSIAKYGSQPLTSRDLLNLLKKADSILQCEADEYNCSIEDTY